MTYEYFFEIDVVKLPVVIVVVVVVVVEGLLFDTYATIAGLHQSPVDKVARASKPGGSSISY